MCLLYFRLTKGGLAVKLRQLVKLYSTVIISSILWTTGHTYTCILLFFYSIVTVNKVKYKIKIIMYIYKATYFLLNCNRKTWLTIKCKIIM